MTASFVSTSTASGALRFFEALAAFFPRAAGAQATGFDFGRGTEGLSGSDERGESRDDDGASAGRLIRADELDRELLSTLWRSSRPSDGL